MKKIALLLIPAGLLFCSCQKEVLDVEASRQVNLEKKFGAMPEGVKTPLKANFYSTPRMDLAQVPCNPAPSGFVLPGGFYVGGDATQTGEVQMMNSPFTITGCGFTLEGKLMMTGHGIITADNGDQYYYTGTTYGNPMDGTFTGTVIMNGGTGRFENCTGEVIMTGQNYPNGTASWYAEGWMIRPK